MSYLLRIRKSLGLRQVDVEAATGIDVSTLSLYENGFRKPTVKNAQTLGEFMGFDWTRLFDERKENDRPEHEKQTA